MNKYFFSFILLSFIIGQSVNAQYVTKIYNDENGLPQNSVKSIVQSSSGFIWLATENGLARYDGRNFVTFYAGDYGYSSNRFFYLSSEDGGESIYGLTNQREFIRIKDNFPSLDSSPPKWFVYEISGDSRNILGIPSRIYPNSVSDRTEIILNDDQEFYHQENVFGVIVEGNDIQYSSQLRFQKLGMVMFDETAYVIDAKGGYYRWSKDDYLIKDSINQFSSLSNPRLIWNRAARQAFIVDANNVWLLRPESSGKLRKVILVENYAFNGFVTHTCFWEEESQTLFLGSLSKGMMSIKRSPFELILSNVEMHDETYYELVSLDNRNFYSSNGFYFNIDKGTVKFGRNNRNFRPIVANKDSTFIVRSFLKDVIVTSCESGDCVDNRKFSFDYTISAYFIEGDTLFVSTFNDSVKSQLYKGSVVDFQFELIGEHHQKALSFFRKRDGQLLLGTSSGLLLFDEENNTFSKFSDLVSGEVRSIQELDSGYLWVATYGKGVFVIDRNDIVKRLPLDRKKYLNFSHYFIQDNNGFVWIPTNRGLFQYNKDDVYRYLRRNTEPLFANYYDVNSGLFTNEFNGGCQVCGLRLSNGKVYLPSMSGITSFVPEEIHFALPSKNLQISDIRIDDQEVFFENELRVPRGFRSLSFQVLSPDFGNPYNIKIESRITDREDREWTPVPDNGKIVMYSLPPGKYDFVVRKQVGFGREIIYQSFTINVPESLTATWWFFVIILGVLLILALVFIRARTVWFNNYRRAVDKGVQERTKQIHNLTADFKSVISQQKRVNTNKNRVIAVLAHDIRSPLRYLGFMIRELSEKLPAASKSDKEDFKAAQETCEKLYDYVTEILKDQKLESETGGVPIDELDIRELIEQKIAIFKSVARLKNINLVYEIDANTQLYGNSNLLSIIIHNLIDNALKYSNKGTVRVTFEEKDGYNVLKVSDEGKGFDVEKAQNQKGGLGLEMVRELATLLGGNLKIESSTRGTTVSLSFR